MRQAAALATATVAALALAACGGSRETREDILWNNADYPANYRCNTGYKSLDVPPNATKKQDGITARITGGTKQNGASSQVYWEILAPGRDKVSAVIVKIREYDPDLKLTVENRVAYTDEANVSLADGKHSSTMPVEHLMRYPASDGSVQGLIICYKY